MSFLGKIYVFILSPTVLSFLHLNPGNVINGSHLRSGSSSLYPRPGADGLLPSLEKILLWPYISKAFITFFFPLAIQFVIQSESRLENRILVEVQIHEREPSSASTAGAQYNPPATVLHTTVSPAARPAIAAAPADGGTVQYSPPTQVMENTRK